MDRTARRITWEVMMAVIQDTVPGDSLTGTNGELLSVRIEVPWRQLEELLDALAALTFPINPKLGHGSPTTTVEFPAYSGQMEEVRAALKGLGSTGLRVEIHRLWPELASGPH
jgi:hypothetical protein